MSEYFYHIGTLKFTSVDKAEAFYKGAIKTGYIDQEDADNRQYLLIDGTTISIDTNDMASMPLSIYEDFRVLLETCVKDLAEPAEIETYLYGKGYGKIYLDPVAQKSRYSKISTKDPHNLSSKPSTGTTSLHRTHEDVISELMKSDIAKELNLDKSTSRKLITAYYKVVKDYLVKTDTVDTPLGEIGSMESYLEGEGLIAIFLISKSLGKRK